MRATTAFCRLLRLPGIRVREVAFEPDRVAVTVSQRQRRLSCPDCSFTTASRYDTRPAPSTWRHLDLGIWRLEIRADLRRLECRTHGVRTEGVPFARPGAQYTKDVEDLVGYLATTMDKTAICRLVRVDWDTVGRMITRVMHDSLDPRRLDELFNIGVDEVSWSYVGDPVKGLFCGCSLDGRDAAVLGPQDAWSSNRERSPSKIFWRPS